MTLDTRKSPGICYRPNEPPRSLATPGVSRGSRSGPRWHCAWTKHGRERQAATSITSAGFEAYLPLHLERTPCWHKLITPVFPRYVFLRFDPHADAWGVVQNLRGVCGLIRHGHDLPTALPDHAITELLARTSTRGIVDDPEERPYDGPGAGYRPIWQPMAGLDAGARARLLVRLFGASVTTEADTP
jgi:transcriptional antiterminator RfaH